MTRLLAIILLFTAAAAQARLGETLEQIKARYGEPYKTQVTNSPTGTTLYRFKKNGVKVNANIWNGSCAQISFEMEDGSDFSTEQMTQLRDANHPGPWVVQRKNNAERIYRSQDGTIELHLTLRQVRLFRVDFFDAAVKQEAEAKAERERKRLEAEAAAAKRAAEMEKQKGDLSGF